MLTVPTRFPMVGSYCLWTDPNVPPAQQSPQLARLQGTVGPGGMVLISLPLKAGASGCRRVHIDQLTNGDPLTNQEKRDLADLQRRLGALEHPRRSPFFKREDALRRRAIWSVHMLRQLDELHRLKRQAA